MFGRLAASTEAKQANAETKILIQFLIIVGWESHERTTTSTTLVKRLAKLQEFAGIGLLGVEGKPAF
jgi:hypothetical protein